MPRFLHVLALAMAFAISGAPSWIAELTEDDCAEKCADESGCPDEGCADCSVICSSCPRTHYLPPHSTMLAPISVGESQVASDAVERMPIGPPPQGVFHPPRRVG